MATKVLTDAVIILGGVNLSDHANQVTLNYEAETQDDTVFGDDTRSAAGGLKNWSVEVSFLQDFAAGSVDATLFALIGTTATWSIKGDSAATGVDNPAFGNNVTTGLFVSAPPLGNSVGDMAGTSVSIVPGGASPTLVRATV